MASTARVTYTPEEYLALEREAEYKSELINGQIYAMSGASEEHNLITLNLASEIRQQFKGRSCRVYSADMRVKVSSTGMYTYPDVVAVCGGSIFEDSEVDTLTNPTVITEVLSPSTEAYDRGEKFAHYRRLPSLQEYVLISQDKLRVEHYLRHGDEWIFTELSELDDTLQLTAVDCSVALRDIYDKVEFTTAGETNGEQI
jgi:Uma2 family endonuclease